MLLRAESGEAEFSSPKLGSNKQGAVCGALLSLTCESD